MTSTLHNDRLEEDLRPARIARRSRPLSLWVKLQMKIAANPRNAALAGALTAFAMGTVDVVGKSLNFNAETQNLVFFWTAIIFFAVPALLFVIGVQNMRPNRWFTREYFDEFPKGALRVLCWFTGAVAFSLLYSYLLRLLVRT